MALGSKKLLKLFELVSTGQLCPPLALEIALGKAPFPGEPETETETNEPAAEAKAGDVMTANQVERLTMALTTPTDQPALAEVTTAPPTTTPTPSATPEERLALECDRIRALPKVKQVVLTKKTINVFTNTIYCTDPRDNVVHEIGRFRIELPLVDNIIRWFNLDRTVRDRQAPHIWPQGDGVLGNMITVFPQLLTQREFAIAATMAIVFVESVDIGSIWGRDLSDWPVAKDKMN